jgi:hypothetical protein
VEELTVVVLDCLQFATYTLLPRLRSAREGHLNERSHRAVAREMAYGARGHDDRRPRCWSLLERLGVVVNRLQEDALIGTRAVEGFGYLVEGGRAFRGSRTRPVSA